MKKTNNPASEALMASYKDVAGGENGSEPGAAETREQIGDVYRSGGSEPTFLRDGKDVAKHGGSRPKGRG